jgi:hypothetical protein
MFRHLLQAREIASVTRQRISMTAAELLGRTISALAWSGSTPLAFRINVCKSGISIQKK